MKKIIETITIIVLNDCRLHSASFFCKCNQIDREYIAIAWPIISKHQAHLKVENAP